MPRAKLRIKLPKNTWIHDVSSKNPKTEFSVVAAIVEENEGTGLLEVNGNISGVTKEMSHHAEISELDLLHIDNEVKGAIGDEDLTEANEALIQFGTRNPLILLAARESGVPLKTPFDIMDGIAEWEITASHERLSELGNKLERFGIQFKVEYVREIEPNKILTKRQEQLVAEAVKEGYYDTPRRCSLSDLAEKENIAKSTCSEILHRAESKIAKEFIESV